MSAGGFGLILPHQTIADALTIEEAIDKALRQLHPNLTREAGLDALSLCSGSWPLLVVVEDINKSGQAQYLAEKLAKTAPRVKENNKTSDQSPPRTDREKTGGYYAPEIFFQVVASLGDEFRKQVQRLPIHGTALSLTEGREAYQRRARTKGIFLSAIYIDSVSEASGHDLLLLSRHEIQADGRSPSASFSRSSSILSVSRLATLREEYTASDYRAALRSMARVMLSRRELNPQRQDVLSEVAIEGVSCTDSVTLFIVARLYICRAAGRRKDWSSDMTACVMRF